MKYWEDGFYLEQNKDKTRIEITDEKWQELLNEQSQGKEIYCENGILKTRERQLTEEDIKRIRIKNIKNELTELSYDLIQDIAGEIIEDIEDKKERFISLHNELRELLGKEKRQTKRRNS